MHQRDDNAVLYEKMQAEQEQYKEKLLALPPSELLAKAFEYTWREEVLMSLSGSGLAAGACEGAVQAGLSSRRLLSGMAVCGLRLSGFPA